MAASAQVAVPTGDTATKIIANGTDVDVVTGNSFVLFNAGTVDVLLGGSDLTSSNGLRALVAGATLGIDLGEGEALFALSASGSTAEPSTS